MNETIERHDVAPDATGVSRRGLAFLLVTTLVVVAVSAALVVYVTRERARMTPRLIGEQQWAAYQLEFELQRTIAARSPDLSFSTASGHGSLTIRASN